jgi:hypothetical protein
MQGNEDYVKLGLRSREEVEEVSQVIDEYVKKPSFAVPADSSSSDEYPCVLHDDEGSLMVLYAHKEA